MNCQLAVQQHDYDDVDLGPCITVQLAITHTLATKVLALRAQGTETTPLSQAAQAVHSTICKTKYNVQQLYIHHAPQLGVASEASWCHTAAHAAM